MDSETWKREAEEFAQRTNEALDLLEQEIQSMSSGGSYRAIWERVRSLGESIRLAPAISSVDKIELQRRLNTLVRGLREQQRAFNRQNEADRAEIESRLQLVGEVVEEARGIPDLEEARADLTLIRERITGLSPSFPRAIRTQLWNMWQEINHRAWDRLTTFRQANEDELSRMLDGAHEQIKRHQTRAARDTIRAFHARMSESEVSRKAEKSLRARANELWQTAAEQGREQREHYLAGARQRLSRYLNEVRRNERTREQLVNRVAAMEQQVSNVTTGMGHALARGQLAEAQKALEKLDAETTRVKKQIRELEMVLEGSATQAT
jgi:vacuolar-type H+-ATPase subunit H